MRTIIINAALNGYVVNCGCQTLVYEDAETLIKELREYMHDPHAKEAATIKTAVNRYLIGDLPRNPAAEDGLRTLGGNGTAACVQAQTGARR